MSVLPAIDFREQARRIARGLDVHISLCQDDAIVADAVDVLRDLEKKLMGAPLKGKKVEPDSWLGGAWRTRG